MALEHAILVALAERPGTGYELARRFDKSIGQFWTATHQQIYKVLARMESDGWLAVTHVTQDGRPVDVTVTTGPEGQRATVVLDLARGATPSYRMTYTLPVRRGRYSLLLVPQPLASAAPLHLHISVTDAELGVVSGVHQPVHGVIDRTVSWDDVEQIEVPVHPLGGLRGWLHAFGHFWTHKV